MMQYVKMPNSYSIIGTGYGYYIRTYDMNNEVIYGLGLKLANWVGLGYETKDRAIAAVKRLRKLDLDENFERDRYEVVDGKGVVLWKLKKH